MPKSRGPRSPAPVHYVDERLTSAEAERAMIEGGLSRRRRKMQEDALSAVLILQAWLDYIRTPWDEEPNAAGKPRR